MRLTLRTMLAYLDGILEPADRDEIGRKIEESEFARQLIQRLRDCARNPRLSAPKLSGKAGPDPNMVAEYLDNTLAGERVPDFEKLCLDSDVDLAEVAACHQILTMVLAQPAEIDLEMKQHMYGISERGPQPSAKAGVSGASRGALPDDIWVKPRRRKAEIPDYLRDQPTGFKWKTIAAAVLLLVIVVGALVMALGPLDRTHPLARLLGFGPSVENQAAQNVAAGAQTAGEESLKNPATDHSTSAAPKASDSGNSTGPGEAGPASQTPAAAGSGVNASDKSANEKSVAEQNEGSANAAAQNSNVSATPAPVNPTSANVPPATATNVDVGAAGAPPTDASLSPPPLPVPASSDVAASAPPGGNRAAATVVPQPNIAPNVPAPSDTTLPGSTPIVDANQPPPPAAAENIPLGRLLPSKNTVLLRFDAASSQWAPVSSGAAVFANDRLLVLPTYRPTITLSAGLTLQVPAETQLELKPPDARGVPTVKLVYGRLVVMTAGKGGVQLGLDLGGTSGVVAFVDAESTLGVELNRSFPPGVNPETEAPHIAAELYAVRGHLEWTPIGGASTTLNAPQVLSLSPADTTASAAAANMPKWIDPEQLWPLDAQASDFLAQSLQDGKPLPVALREMVDHRRVEIKSLGAQCLALLDEFEPLVAAFNDPDQRPMWAVEIASVKEALARGSSAASKVHQAFVKQHGDPLGSSLYRMFLGYTKEQLQAGEATVLVDFLDNDSLDCRVLAFANLQDLTNKTFSYRPEAPAASRTQPLRRWQEELHTGAIVPKEAASPK